jgi:hypothetical protein
MICLDVSRNDAHRCLAGVSDGTVTGTVMCGTHIEPDRWGIGFWATGVSADLSHEWVHEELSVGDVVTFRVVEVAEGDSPGPMAPDMPHHSKAMDLQEAREQYSMFRHWMREL